MYMIELRADEAASNCQNGPGDRGLGSTILSPITSGAHNHIKLQACENSVGGFFPFPSQQMSSAFILESRSKTVTACSGLRASCALNECLD